MQASNRLRLAHPNDAFTQCRGDAQAKERDDFALERESPPPSNESGGLRCNHIAKHAAGTPHETR